MDRAEAVALQILQKKSLLEIHQRSGNPTGRSQNLISHEDSETMAMDGGRLDVIRSRRIQRNDSLFQIGRRRFE